MIKKFYTDLSSEAKLAIGNLGALTGAEEFMSGYRYSYKFNNGYGISIIKHLGSYGQDENLWEIGVLGLDNRLCFDTPVADDVIGYLTEHEVMDYAKKIAGLELCDKTDDSPAEHDDIPFFDEPFIPVSKPIPGPDLTEVYSRLLALNDELSEILNLVNEMKKGA